MSITIKLPVILDPESTQKLTSEVSRLAKSIEKTSKVSLGGGTKEAKEYSKALNEITVSAQRTGDTISKLVGKVALWAVATTAIYGPIRAFKDALTELRAIDDELVVVRKVTQSTAAELDTLQKKAFDVASAYGISAADYLNSVAAFARAGYGDLAAQLAELSVKTQLVGDTTSDTANQFLLAVDAAYKYKGSVSELGAVLDGANEIDNNYATSIERIAEGLGIVAPVAAQVGVGIDELTAAIGTITAVTQRSGSEAARALRALFLNIVGDTKTEIDEGVTWTTGEIAGLRDVINLFAADVVAAADAAGTVINPMEAIAALAKAMEQGVLTEQKLVGMVSDIGGKLRTSQLLAIIQNWDMYSEMLETFGDAAGSADAEVSNALDSWTRKAEILKNTWVEVVASFKTTDFAKGLLDTATDLIDGIDGFTTVGLALVAVIGLISKGFTAASASVKKLYLSQLEATIAAGANKIVNAEVAASIANVTAATAYNTAVTEKWTVAQIKAAYAAGKLEKEEIDQLVALGLLSAAEGATTVATWSLKSAWDALTTAIASNPLGLILVVLTGMVVSIGAVIKSSEEYHKKMVEISEEATRAWEKTTSELKEVEKQLAENKSRLEEIAAIDKGLTDPNEVSRLQSENTLLDTQVKLLREKQRIENADALAALYKAQGSDASIYGKAQVHDVKWWHSALGLATFGLAPVISNAIGLAGDMQDAKYEQNIDEYLKFYERVEKGSASERDVRKMSEFREELVLQASAIKEYIDQAAALGDTSSGAVQIWRAQYDAIINVLYPYGEATEVIEETTTALIDSAEAAEAAADAWGLLETAMDDYLSDYKDKIDAQKDAIQRQIDALKQARDTENEQLKIEEAKLAVLEAQQNLLSAQNERNVRYYNAATGQWEWGADSNSVQSAQDALNKAQGNLSTLEQDAIYNKRIKALEAKQGALDAQYDALKKKWDAIQDSLQNNVLNIDEILYDLSINGTPAMKAQVDNITALLKLLGITIGTVAGGEALGEGTGGEALGDTGDNKVINKPTFLMYGRKTPYLRETLGSESKRSPFYDNGGIAQSRGLLVKDTNADEVVLSPDIASRILSPATNAQFTSFVDRLGLLFGMSQNLPSAASISNSGGSITNHNGGNVYINGVKIGTDMLQRPLAEVLSVLALHTNEI